MSKSNDSVDLETFLGVLDREQLQTIIVKLIIKDPSYFELVEEATQFLDHEQLINTLEPLIDIDDLERLITSTTPLRDRFLGYMALELHENALIILYAYSNQLLMNIIEIGLDKDNTIQQRILNELETDWKNLCTIYVPNPITLEKLRKEEELKLAKAQAMKKFGNKPNERVLTKKATENNQDDDMEDYIPKVEAPLTYMNIFKSLAEWHEQLKPTLGPVFGDALRVLKVRIIAETEKQKAAVKGAGRVTLTPTSTTSAPVSSKVAEKPTKKEHELKNTVSSPTVVEESKKSKKTSTLVDGKKTTPLEPSTEPVVKRKATDQPQAIKKQKK